MRLFNRQHSYDSSVDAFIDGELTAPERAKFEQHLAGCDRCQVAVVDSRSAKRLMAKLPAVAVPRSFTLTPEMAAANRPERTRSRATGTPLYLGLARMGAGLSVAAFASVFVVTSLGSESADDGDTASLSSADAPVSGQAPEKDMNLESAESPVDGGSPQLPVAGSGDVGGQSLATSEAQATVPPEVRGTPAPPATGIEPAGGEDDASRNSTDDDAGPDTALGDAFGYDPALTATSDDDSGDNGLVVGLGAVAGLSLLALTALEVQRRRSNPA